MKQNVFLRMVAILLFLLASIAIKSERSCTPKLNCFLKMNVESEILNQPNDFPLFPLDEGFLMKI